MNTNTNPNTGTGLFGSGHQHQHGGGLTGHNVGNSGYAQPGLPMGTQQVNTTTTTTGGMQAPGTTSHRGPMRAAEDMIAGATTGGRQHNVGGTTAVPVVGTTGYGTTAAKPPVGQRIAGEAEKLAGKAMGNPTMVARGEEKKTGIPNLGTTQGNVLGGHTTTQGTGFGNTNATRRY